MLNAVLLDLENTGNVVDSLELQCININAAMDCKMGEPIKPVFVLNRLSLQAAKIQVHLIKIESLVDAVGKFYKALWRSLYVRCCSVLLSVLGAFNRLAIPFDYLKIKPPEKEQREGFHMLNKINLSTETINDGSVRLLIRAKAKLFILLTSVEQCLSNPLPIVKPNRVALVKRMQSDLDSISMDLESAVKFLARVDNAYKDCAIQIDDRLAFATELTRVEIELQEIANRYVGVRLTFNKTVQEFEDNVNTNFIVS
jgi:hypothetical protein